MPSFFKQEEKMKTSFIRTGFLTLLFSWGLLLTTTLYAKSLDKFHKRFQIIRAQDGKLIGIRDNSLSFKFSAAPYVKMIKEQLKKEQDLIVKSQLAGEQVYEKRVRSMLEESREEMLQQGYSNEEFEKYLKVTIESLKKLAELNIEAIFSNPIFNDIVAKFEGKITEAILLLDPTILANVSDPTFFYKRNVTYKAVTWALDFARKRLSQIPILNTVSYVIVQVEGLITERRNFHQNMLLHYLENFSEEELGLTHDEVNMIWSSIYESRIPWFSFWESSSAKLNWMKYGSENFYLNYRMATQKLRNAGSIYSEVGERINYAFQNVMFNNQRVIINLFDDESMIQKRPAIAYNYDKPKEVSTKRIMLNLAQLGLSFVPINQSFKDLADAFIKSFYANQKITEGALYGYFESIGEGEGSRRIEQQYLNPFDAQLSL